MGHEVLIGIDLGTTVLKAAAFDARSGRALGQAGQRLPIALDANGKREQRPSDLDTALAGALSSLCRQVGRDWPHISGISLASQGGSGMIVDRATGRPRSPLMLWNDLRFLPHLPAVQAQRPAAWWRRLGWRDTPGWGLGRLAWLQHTRPRLIQPDNLYVGAGEYVFYRLTGAWRQDPCNALQIGCYDVAHRRLSADPLRLIDLDLSFVAPLRQGHETTPLSGAGGRWLGLSAGIPVAGPYMDHEAGYLAAAGLSRHPLQFSLGTAWVGNFVLPRQATWSSPLQLVIPSPADEGWLVIQPLLTGNVTWDWALACLVDADRTRAIAQLAQLFADQLLPPAGLTALPWLNMPNPLWSDLLGGGAFFGIGPSTDKPQLLRAIAAAMCYETIRVFGQVKDQVDSIILGGGASKGAFFRQLLASLFAPVPAHALAEEDWAGTRGALYAFSPAVAAASAVKIARPSPRLGKAIQAGYDRYLDLFDRLYGQLPISQPLAFRPGKGHSS